MIILANLLNSIADLLSVVLNLMFVLVLARSVLSWVNPDPYNPIVRFIYGATDPLLNMIYRKVRLQFGSIDFTPMLLFLLIIFLQSFLVTTIKEYAITIKRDSFMQAVEIPPAQ